MTIAAGTKLGRYEIRSKIGEGGMGEVYLARDTKLDRKVALKILPAEVASHQDRMRRFVQEAKAASALNHPNIITIHEIDQSDSIHFIATEFVDGETLREHMRRTRLKLSEVLDVTAQIANALSAAHAARIAHRDIKPENVMLRRDGIVKVLDFGLAKLTETSAPGIDTQAATRPLIQTEPGRVMGTVAYMSPEQVRGLELDARTDIWSLGVVLYEMLAGQAPFAGETSSHISVSILEKEAEPLGRFAPQAPAELQRIVRKTLAKDRDDRYQTARDLLIDLKTLRRELELQSEIERSIAPTGETLTASSAQAVPATKIDSLSQTTSVAELRPTSSAEYLIGELKRHKRGVIVGLVALIAIATITAVVLFALKRSQVEQTPKQRTLARLTFDAGLQSEPTWSPDGRFIACSSDRSGNFDIWIKPVGEGDPIQLTKSPAHDWQPDWSPDGQRVVFRSEREGGGLYIVPAFGGNERKISAFGYRPRWSPDGSQILFLSSALQATFEIPKLYVVTLDGKPARRVLAEFPGEFTNYVQVAWHPDGKRISLWGPHRKVGWSFWTAPLEGGAPVKSDLEAKVDQQIRETDIAFTNFRWAPSGRALYFEGASHEARNLWKIEVDPQSLGWVAGPERLTTGSGLDTNLAISPDGKKLAFTARTERTRIWAVPLNAATGLTAGVGQPVTPAEMEAWAPDLSRDGKKLVFAARRAAKEGLWEKSLPDGRETLLVGADDFSRNFPHWSRDGLRLAYNRIRRSDQENRQPEQSPVLLTVSDASEQVLAESGSATDTPSDWSADGQRILAWSSDRTPNRTAICLFPVSAAPHAETGVRVVVSNPDNNLYNARFSPDERWISFNAISADDPEASTVYVVPASGGEWVRVTEGKFRDAKPRWSADGKTIYFVSNRGGFFNVWGIRFDPVAGKPAGDPFRVTAFESPGQMVLPNVQRMQISLAADRLVLPIMEVSGSIWILENVDR